MKENAEIEAKIARMTDEIGAPGIDDVRRAELYRLRGLMHFKLGRHGAAMSDYAEAVALNPDDPAAQLLESTRDIMQFYNKDLYNP